MESPERTQAVTRTAFLAGGIAVWAGAIFGRLFYVQIARHKHYAGLANQQQFEIVDIPGPRGSIFDRSGEIFAMSEPVDSVYVSPILLPDLAVAARVIAPVVHLNRNELYARLKSFHDDRKRRGFCWIKRKLTKEERTDIESLRLPWIKLREDSIRRYPQQTVAAHVIGSVDFEEKGNAGLERSLDSELRGVAGSEQMLTDVHKHGIASELLDQPKLGTDLVLTIDERIQSAAEQDLKAAVENSKARTGTVVVMNPRNGEILAMASYPTFDPNKAPLPGEAHGGRLNRAVEAPFEPGSVFKVITLSTALETTNLRPESVLPCGSLNMFNRVIHEAHGTYGPLSMADVLAKSSNVGAIQIGMKIGKEKLYEYVRRFGFGQKTGVCLPYESSGRLRKLAKWQPGSICSIPMGHEISVTAVQLARACSVIANGGLLVQPKLILQRKRAGEVLEEAKSPPPIRIIKPETAFTMRGMMEGVVLLPYGTGKKARLSGYSCAGKTGSAQIYDYEARHYTKTYNASFMGFAPVTNPAIVVVVTLNGTTGVAGYGGTASGPVFRTVAQEALRVLDVPKDIPEPDEEPEHELKDDTVYENDVAIAELSDPPPLDESEETPDAEKPEQAEGSGPRVPDFKGMTMRAVLEEASAMGLPVSLDGRGVARMQMPRPGSILPPGSRIRVVFAR